MPQPQEDPGGPGHNRYTSLDVAHLVVLSLTLIAAAFAAFFTGRQAWVSRDTEINQLKAYAYISDVKWSAIVSDIPITATISAANGGATPAYNAIMNAYMGFFPEYPDKPITDYQSATPIESESLAFLYKDRAISVTSSLATPLTDDQVKDIKAGLSRIYVWGIVTYEDAFRRPRYLHFCYMTFGEHSAKGEPVICDEYNDADRPVYHPVAATQQARRFRPWGPWRFP
jgi:hypothetical protein